MCASAAHPDGAWPFDVLEVMDVHDGDTPLLRIDQGRNTHGVIWLRMAGINAPELHNPGGYEARDYLAGILEGPPKLHGMVALTHRKIKSDLDDKSFDRWVGECYLDYSGDRINVAALMVASGHAVTVRLGAERA